MKILIAGGCKNGKSTYAEKIAASLAKRGTAPLYYIATMLPVDDEDEARIFRHQASRDGLGFQTIEQNTDIAKLLTNPYDANGTFLLDSTTALLANEMFPLGSTHSINLDAPRKVMNELLEVMNTVTNIVIVSDYIYSDAAFYDDYTERFRAGLGLIDCDSADVCDIVIEVCYGEILIHKGQELWEEICETIV